MNLQAKLTLWYVMLAMVIVGSISGVDLANNMQVQFESTLDRADLIKATAGKFVSKTLNSQRTKPLKEVLRDPELTNDLQDLLGKNAILEIAVLDPKTDMALADSIPDKVGEKIGPFPDFRDLVNNQPFYDKWKVLRGSEQKYQLDQRLGTDPAVALLT